MSDFSAVAVAILVLIAFVMGVAVGKTSALDRARRDLEKRVAERGSSLPTIVSLPRATAIPTFWRRRKRS